MVILYIMGQRPGKDGKMKQRLFEQKNEITIPAADLEQANLMGFDRLELHLLDQAAVVIPGEMTANLFFKRYYRLRGLEKRYGSGFETDALAYWHADAGTVKVQGGRHVLPLRL